MPNKGVLVIYSGFSGAGKDTVLHSILPKGNYWLSVSATTRKPRPTETDGKDYFFISTEEFQRRIENGDFLEWAQFSGNYYGTPKATVEEKMKEGYDVILEIDAQGGGQIKRLFPDAVSVFMTAPSYEALKDRLYKRGTETEEQIKQRLFQVGRELTAMSGYDFVVVNDVVEETAEKIHAIIQTMHERTCMKQELINQFRTEIARQSAQ